jgi:hypothetical protein
VFTQQAATAAADISEENPGVVECVLLWQEVWVIQKEARSLERTSVWDRTLAWVGWGK